MKVVIKTDPELLDVVEDRMSEDDKWRVPYLLRDRPPQWIKEMSWRDKHDGLTYKKCPVPHNFLMNTIVLPMPVDWEYKKRISEKDNGLEPYDAADQAALYPKTSQDLKKKEIMGKVTVRGSHSDDQLAGYAPGYSNVKFGFNFFFNFPEKRTELFVQAPFLENSYFESDFITMPAYLSCERMISMMVNTLVKKDLVVDKYKTIPAGTPMAYVTIPNLETKLELEYKPYYDYTTSYKLIIRKGAKLAKHFRVRKV